MDEQNQTAEGTEDIATTEANGEQSGSADDTAGTDKGDGTPQEPPGGGDAKPKKTKPAKAKKAPKAKVEKKAKPAPKPKAEKKVKPGSKPKAAKPTSKKAQVATVQDHRLPPAGTVIEKRDRHGDVRCKCVVEDDGRIRYAGKKYDSLSGAAMAAAGDLGLKSTALNGWLFWGLIASPSASDPVEALQKLSARYMDRLKSVGASEDGDLRARAAKEVGKHLAAVGKLSTGIE